MTRGFTSLQLLILCSTLLGIYEPYGLALGSSSLPAPQTTPTPPPKKPQPVKNPTPPVTKPRPAPTQAPQPEPIQEPHPPAPSQDISLDHKAILSQIENLITAIQANQIQKAYNEYTSDQFKKVSSIEDFDNFVKGYPELSSSKNAFFGYIRNKPLGVSFIEGTLISTTGESVSMEFDLIKENEQWKIIGIKVLPPEKIETTNLPGTKNVPAQTEGPLQLNPLSPQNLTSPQNLPGK